IEPAIAARSAAQPSADATTIRRRTKGLVIGVEGGSDPLACDHGDVIDPFARASVRGTRGAWGVRTRDLVGASWVLHNGNHRGARAVLKSHCLPRVTRVIRSESRDHQTRRRYARAAPASGSRSFARR